MRYESQLYCPVQDFQWPVTSLIIYSIRNSGQKLGSCYGKSQVWLGFVRVMVSINISLWLATLEITPAASIHLSLSLTMSPFACFLTYMHTHTSPNSYGRMQTFPRQHQWRISCGFQTGFESTTSVSNCLGFSNFDDISRMK